MSYDALIDAHKAQLGRVAERFTAPDNADFKRHLANAVWRLSEKRPQDCVGDQALSAGVSEYPAPEGIIGTPVSEWGRSGACACNCYIPSYPGFIGFPPLLSRSQRNGVSILRLSTAPTANQIASWGATMVYRYQALQIVTETEISIDAADQPLLLLAAMIEAMREMAADTTVIQFQKGLGNLATIGTTAGSPSYLYEKLIAEFDSYD